MNYGGDVMWWQIAIVAGVVLVWGIVAWYVGVNEGYHRGRADGWDQRKELYR